MGYGPWHCRESDTTEQPSMRASLPNTLLPIWPCGTLLNTVAMVIVLN